ncbi:MAG: thioesterase [Zetaproteobacteria bacterium CG_4_9_14_3_um_filter_53_7]|nr:MAG: thioesterase [Zetaproteobacteria bacterium CG_4_9_14_3_um_filter_53_7]
MNRRPTVVLIHGLFGFRKLLWFEYFRGIRERYEKMGLRIVIPSLPWVSSIEKRAAALAKQLQHEQGPLHLVAHSMGGLDARYWISRLGGGEKVASLTTLATPHRGSAAADFVCTHLSPFRLLAGVHNMTTESMSVFNARTPDLPHINYRSYSATRPLGQLPWIVRRYARHIQQLEGDNDGQVSVASARRDRHIITLPCDHYELIMRNFWFNPFSTRIPFDAMPVYREIATWILSQERR